MDRIQLFTNEILTSGQQTIFNTISRLNQIIQGLTDVVFKLKRIQRTVEIELNAHNKAFDEYEAQRQVIISQLAANRTFMNTQVNECNERKRIAEDLAKRSRTWSWIILGVGSFLSLVSAFFLGPIGPAIGLQLTGMSNQVKDSVMGAQPIESCAGLEFQYKSLLLMKDPPSKENAKKLVNEFHNAMIKTIKDAVVKCEDCQKAAQREATYVSGVQGKVINIERQTQIYFQSYDMFDLVFTDFENLVKGLDRYVRRHSGGALVDFETDNPFQIGRARRDVSNETDQHLDMEFDALTQNVNDFLNQTEVQRNKRFWVWDDDQQRREMLFQMHELVKFA